MTIRIGNDTNNTNINGELSGVYYYALDKSKIESNNGANTSILGYVPTIQSISFNPFFNVADTENPISFLESEFDTSHYGNPSSTTKPKVYRITNFPTFSKTLFTQNLKSVIWDLLPKDYETRLLFYPFRYYLLCDYFNTPLMIKPELLNQNGEMILKVTLTLSQTSKYNLYVENYKNDMKGNIEGLTNCNPLLFPVSSSAYSQFLATSSSSFNTSNQLASLENDKSLKQGKTNLKVNQAENLTGGISNVVSNLLLGNIGGAIQGGVNTGFGLLENHIKKNQLYENYDFKNYQIEAMALAQKSDLLNTPRTMRTLGNEPTFNMGLAEKKVELLEYGLSPYYEDKISKHFKKYGYSVNRYGQPVLTNRRYWNFVKLVKCNLDTKGLIPNKDKEEIEKIFESGITFWHVENGAKPLDYSQENLERDRV